MHARVTLLEVDVVRTAVADAVDRFRLEVLPELRAQDGYRGVYVLATPEGKVALVSLWDTPAQADPGATTGFYAETLARYMTLFAAPPGRERYEVVVADLAAPVSR